MMEWDQLWQTNQQLQSQVKKVTLKLRALWPVVADLVIEAPKDFLSITLVDYCDHIQSTCIELVAINKEMKKSLDMAKAMLLI